MGAKRKDETGIPFSGTGKGIPRYGEEVVLRSCNREKSWEGEYAKEERRGGKEKKVGGATRS